MHVIHWDDESTWPGPPVGFLENSQELFLGWDILGDGRSRSTKAKQYDRACAQLRDVLSPFHVLGWHCTRLTPAEISQMRKEGMQLPSPALLQARVGALVEAGTLSSKMASLLLSRHQAADSNRAGMIWFCFFPPVRAGQHGIERFFRCWGGEALYNSHEDDPVTAPVLARIGVPCLVEAAVPLAGLSPHSFLEEHLVRRFLLNRGHHTMECCDHEDRCLVPLPAHCILRIIEHPTEEFCTLTGCSSWKPPLPAFVL